MKQNMKKLLSLVLALAMLLSMLPTTVLATDVSGLTAITDESGNVTGYTDGSNFYDLSGNQLDAFGNPIAEETPAEETPAEETPVNTPTAETPVLLTSTATTADVIEIYDATDLQAFASAVNNGDAYEGKTVALTASIDLSSVAWTPIGNGTRASSSYTGSAFKGVFDGNDYTITGLTAPLFGVVNGGTVKNVNLASVNIISSADSVGAGVAILVGDGLVDDVDVTSGSVSGAEGVGGVVGRLMISGTVQNCDNAASVTQTTGNDTAGGIVGKAYYNSTTGTMTISNCTNSGAVSSSYAAGGIVGFSAANVSGCTNSGIITAGQEAGGIVGEQVNNGTVSGNTNTANITASKSGGIIGWIRYQDNSSAYPVTATIQVTNNNNSGAITGDTAAQSSAGGIVGLIYNQATVTGNRNTAASITAATFAGGIVGGLQDSSDNVKLDAGTYVVTGNTSTTAAANIQAECTSLVAYSNVANDSVSAMIENNIVPVEGAVAYIGDQGYTTLAEAIAAANGMTGDVTVEIYGKTAYTAETADLTGAYDSISFVGKTADAEISIIRDGSNGYISGQGNDCTVNFTNLILSKPTGAYANDAGFMNVYFTVYRVGAVNYTNCTFPDGACAQGCPVTYTNCKFANQTSGEYSLWVYANTTTTVTGGEFTGVRGVKMYGEGAAKTGNLVMTNTTFTESVTEKPAIVLTYGESVNLDGNTYPAKGVFELDKDGEPNGTTVTADAEEIVKITCVNDDGVCGVLVDGKIYTTVAQAAAVATSGSTVTLLHDSTETVQLPAGVTLNKNGYTAEGVTTATPAGPVEVATYDELVAALANGGEIKLTADITLDTAITCSDGVTLDLNGKTLYVNVENSYYNNVTIKNGNIVLGKDDVHVCDGYFLVNEGKTLVLNKVNVSSSAAGIKGYAVFHLKTGANLDLVNSQLVISDNEYSAGYIVYASESTATVDITGTTVTGTNVNGIVHAATVIDSSTVILTSNGTTEHGINRSAVTINNSTVTISGGTGRGITAQHGNLVITGTSVVSISNMGEATIELRDNQSLTVAETATVTVDNAVSNTGSGAINGTVTDTSATPAYVAEVNGVQYESLQAAVDAASVGDTVTLLRDATGAGVVFEADDNVTIDLNGKIYTLSESVGSSAQYGTVGFYLWAGSTVTVKNGTINMVVDVDGDAYTFFKMFHTYGNLTLTDVTLDCKNGVAYNGETDVGFIAVESDNGTVAINGATSITNCSKLSPETWTVVAYKTGQIDINTTGTIDGPVVSYGSNAAITVKNGTFINSNTQYAQLYTISSGSIAVSGGTYSDSSALSYLAAGYTLMLNGDGTYGVQPSTASYVASVNGQDYLTLQAAVDAANGATVYLKRDVTLTETLTIEKAVTIDLAGKTITGADGAIVFNVKADTTIKNGKIVDNKSGTSSGLIDIYANLTLDAVTVETSAINALRFKTGSCTATLTNCEITGDLKGYGGSVWDIKSGTYKCSTTATSDHVNGGAISGGTFHYVIDEVDCAPGYVVVDNGDGTYTVKYAPACFIDANKNGTLDDGEIVYGNLDQVFANHKDGEVNVVLTADIVANGKVDTDADATYNFTTNVASGVTMDFLFADNWNYIQKMSIGENITLNATYLAAWTDLDIYGTVNTDYAYFLGADVTVHEGAVLNVVTGDATVQVKGGTTLTVNGTVNTGTLNVWSGASALTVSGANAKVNASWIDIWDGTPVVTVENGATIATDNIKASRGGSITVNAATLDAETIEIGHNGESAGNLTETGASTVNGTIKLTATGSTVVSDGGLKVTTDIEGYQVVYANGSYTLAAITSAVQIGETKYNTLADAFAAAKKGDTITLLSDVTLTEGVSIMDSSVLTDITLDGNNKTITLDMNGSGTGVRFGGEWATGVKIHDLTITGSAKYALWLNGGTSSELTNVTVTGTYDETYGAVIFYGTHGATLNNCQIVSGFTNGQAAYPLNLTNGSMITTLLANDGADMNPKIFIDETSSITTVYADDHTAMIDVNSMGCIGTILESDTGKAMVAEVNGVQYSTLELALANAQTGDTIKLLANASTNTSLVIPNGKTITVDLNGYEITAGDSFDRINWGIFAVERGGALMINDTSANGTGKITSGNVYAAVLMTTSADTNTAGTAKLTVNGGTLTGMWYAVAGNGSRNNTEININGGKLTSTESIGLGIFHPQAGTLNISGGTIEAAVGIEMRSGTLNMTGGSVISNSTDFETAPSDSGGTVKGGVAVVLSQHTTNQPVSINITGGTLNGTYAFYQDRLILDETIPSTNISATIASDVTLTGEVVAAEETFEMVEADGGYTLKQYVAAIVYKGTVISTYETLADAIAKADANETVKLCADITLDQMVTIPAGKVITLELNGKTIKAGYSVSSGNDCVINVAYGADLTIKDSVGTGVIDGSTLYGAVKMTNTGDNAANGTAKLTVDGGKLIGNYYAVVGNGSRSGTAITINDGTLTAAQEVWGYGIFHPQNGTLTVNGGTIEAATGIEMRAGTLTVTGGTIKSTATELATSVSDSGSTVSGAAIALSQHNTDWETSVTVTGGTLSGPYAFYQNRLVKTYKPSTGISATIASGVTLAGEVVAAEDGFEMPKAGDGSYTLEAIAYVAQIGETKYETLAEAFAAAQKGDTITLLSDVTLTETILITDNNVLSDITLDGNGKTITVDMTSGAAIRFGQNVEGAYAWATGVKIKNLTMTSAETNQASMAIFLCGGTTSELTNVKVTGNFTYGVNFYGTHGGTLTDCDIVSGFTNAQCKNPLVLNNSKIGTLHANEVTEASGTGKITIGEESSINTLVVWGGNTKMIASGLDQVTAIEDYDGNPMTAELAGVQYAALTDAVADVTEANNTITLLANVTETVEVSKALTIVLNGFTATVTVADDSGLEVDTSDETKIVVKVKSTSELATFLGSSVTLGNTLDMNFYISCSYFDGSEYYAMVAHETDTGVQNTTIDFDEWIVDNGYYRITYAGIMAKQMSDKITITIYDDNGTQVSVTREDGIRAYALRTFSNQPEKAKPMIIDMINYGAAAQTNFSYKTDDLATSGFTTEQLAYGTETLKNCVDTRVIGTNYYGTSFSLENQISMNMYFSNLTTDMYAMITFTDHFGSSKSVRIEGTEFVKDGSYYRIKIDEMVVADGRCNITCTVYDSTGSNIVASATDSMESYVARTISQTVNVAMMKFSDSAYTYLHS